MNPCSQSPSSFTIQTNKLADRLTVAQVCTIIRCCTGLGGPKQLSISHRSPPQGSAGDRWMEIRAEGYLLAFWVNEGLQGSLSSVFFCKSPKGAEWFAPQDQGKPMAKFTPNELEEISKKLYVGWPEERTEVLVAQIWRVAIRSGEVVSFVGGSQDSGTLRDGTKFPKELLGHASFATKQEAELVSKSYADYRKRLLLEQREARENPAPKKKQKS